MAEDPRKIYTPEYFEKFAEGRPVEPLWPDEVPLAEGDQKRDRPTMTIFLPEKGKGNGSAVVILPGGGYVFVCMGKEGYAAAKWFAELGVAAFVVNYRVNNTSGTSYGHPVPLIDARRAMRVVRGRAQEFGIDASRVGIMGYSAGGHLASTVATHFEDTTGDEHDDLREVETRPAFQVLVYPVITMKEEYGHGGCRESLLGKDASAEMVERYSNEAQVTANTPPAFIVSTSEDKSVPAENSVNYYLAMRRAGVAAELHVYESGPHGFGMIPGFGPASDWPGRCEDWMRNRGILEG